MFRKLYLLAMVIAIACVIGCNSDQSTSVETSSENLSRVQLKLVDAPGDYLEVNVEILDVLYNSAGDDQGWVSLGTPDGEPLLVDLTTLISGNELILADEIIESGPFSKVRLVLGENNTLVIEEEGGNKTVDLKTPSGQQSGLKINLDTELEPGFSYSFILDWDVQKSIVEAGNSGNYNLKPVIRAHAEVNSGSIQGTVVGKLNGEDIDPVPIENSAVEVYLESDLVNYVASTLTDSDGNFLIQGLDPGTYIIKINQENYLPYETPSEEAIEVVAGVVTTVDEPIELQLDE